MVSWYRGGGGSGGEGILRQFIQPNIFKNPLQTYNKFGFLNDCTRITNDCMATTLTFSDGLCSTCLFRGDKKLHMDIAICQSNFLELVLLINK